MDRLQRLLISSDHSSIKPNAAEIENNENRVCIDGTTIAFPDETALFTQVNVIGKGSYGIVYKHECGNSNMKFAIKHLFSLDFIVPSEDRKTLEREIENHVSLRHKHILTSYGFHEIYSKPCLVLELAEKGSLSSQMEQKTFLRKNILLYAKQTLLGLEYLHEKKIVHRDLRCANILQKVDERIVIADFGLSKKIEKITPNTEVGNDYWKAPEVITDNIIVALEQQFLMDIWSLGVSLLEMFYEGYWNIPYIGKYNNKQYMFQLGSGNVPSTPESAPNTIRSLIQGCLQYYLTERKTATELLSVHFGFVDDERLKTIELQPLEQSLDGYCFVQKPQTPLTPHLGRKIDILRRHENYQQYNTEAYADKLQFISHIHEVLFVEPQGECSTGFIVQKETEKRPIYKVSFNESEFVTLISDVNDDKPIYALRAFEKNQLQLIDCTQDGDMPCAFLKLHLRLFKKDKGILKDASLRNSVIRVMSLTDLSGEFNFNHKNRFLTLELKKKSKLHHENGYTFDSQIKIQQTDSVVARFAIKNSGGESAVLLSYKGTDSALITLIVCQYLQKIQKKDRKWKIFSWKDNNQFKNMSKCQQ